MALAPYFGKAALSAASVLEGMSPDGFRSRIEPLAVALAFDESAVRSFEGQVVLELAANLLARLYPAIGVFGPSDQRFVSHLCELMIRLNPNIEFRDNGPFNAQLVIGTPSYRPGAEFTVHAGSTDWTSYVSSRQPVCVGHTTNPFGAGAAACFATAFIFRYLFRSELNSGSVEEDLSLSLASYDDGKNTSGPPLDGDLEEAALVGAGAIGNAMIWSLARTQLQGILYVVDPEDVDNSNPQRYVLTGPRDIGSAKVVIAERALAGCRLQCLPYKEDWSGFLTQTAKWELPLVCAAVDTGFDRCAIQSSLPKYVLNAWTQRGDLGVSRHGFADASACLACLYMPNKSKPSERELVASAIQWKGDIQEIGNLLYFNSPLSRSTLEKIAADLEKNFEDLAQFEGKSLRTLYREGICGGLVAVMGGEKAVVPMAFQSALAGVMLAAEMVKFAAGRPVEQATSTKIDLLRPLGTVLSQPEGKHVSGRCICQDPVYLDAYKKKYPEII